MDGVKTQTRRIKKDDKPPVRQGQSVAVQPGRGQKQVGRIVINEIHAESLGDITDSDAKAEGCKDRQDFIGLWQSIHGSFDEDLEVWVLEFRGNEDLGIR